MGTSIHLGFGVHHKGNSHPLRSMRGSFFKVLDTVVGGGRNQFHLLRLDGRDTSTAKRFGTLNSWALRLGKWEESDRNIREFRNLQFWLYYAY